MSYWLFHLRALHSEQRESFMAFVLILTRRDNDVTSSVLPQIFEYAAWILVPCHVLLCLLSLIIPSLLSALVFALVLCVTFSGDQ